MTNPPPSQEQVRCPCCGGNRNRSAFQGCTGQLRCDDCMCEWFEDKRTPAQAVDAGPWQMVPKEPTPEMWRAGRDAVTTQNRWSAMLAAAPSPPPPDAAQMRAEFVAWMTSKGFDFSADQTGQFQKLSWDIWQAARGVKL